MPEGQPLEGDAEFDEYEPGARSGHIARQLHEMADRASRRARLLRESAAVTRRFAQVETQTAAILRKMAQDSADPATAERRRRAAMRAEQEAALALERAHRLDPVEG